MSKCNDLLSAVVEPGCSWIDIRTLTDPMHSGKADSQGQVLVWKHPLIKGAADGSGEDVGSRVPLGCRQYILSCMVHAHDST
jgi:hypothetical protein